MVAWMANTRMTVEAKSVGKYTLEGLQIGSSAYTRTELATHQITRSKVVIKLSDAKIPNGRQHVERLHHVARILSQVRHPNVIRLYEVIQAEARYYAIVLELCAGGTLEEYVRMKSEHFTEQTARTWLFQMLSAFHYLHERGIVHRYTRPSNILLSDGQRRLKLSDFSFAYNSNHATLKASVPLEVHQYNNAPELHMTEAPYHPTTIDIWTLGTVTLHMLSGGSLPSKHQPLGEIVSLPINDEFWKETSSECQDFLGRILEFRWDRRASLLEIETHEWMTMEKGKSFSPSRPPPRNHALRSLVFKRLSNILKLDSKQLRMKVHEYRVDEFSAMANLMTDDFLAMKEESDKRYKKPRNKCLNSKQYSVPCNSTRSKMSNYGNDGRLQEGAVLKGSKIKLRPDSAHSMRCSVQYGGTYKIQDMEEEIFSKGKINAILDKILSCSPLPQDERFPVTKGRTHVRPLGNATSYNMTMVRNFYDQKRKGARSAVRSVTQDPDMLIEEKERSKSAHAIGRINPLTKQNIHQCPNLLTKSVQIDRCIGDGRSQTRATSNLATDVIRITPADEIKICENRHQEARDYSKVMSIHDIGVTGGTVNIKKRPHSSKSSATDGDYRYHTKVREMGKNTTAPHSVSRSRPSSVCIRNVSRVLLSLPVVSLDACRLPTGWRMEPGALTPKRRFVGATPLDKKDRDRTSRVKIEEGGEPSLFSEKFQTPVSGRTGSSRAKSENSVVIYNHSQQPRSRVLGKAAIGHSVSTCTACDLQRVTSMSMLSPAVVRIGCEYSEDKYTLRDRAIISTKTD